MKRLLTILTLIFATIGIFGQGTKSSIYGNLYVIKTTAPTITVQGSGGIIDFLSGVNHVTLTQGTGVLTLAGANLALGTNNLTLTGFIGSTESRVAKGWFTDAEFTNTPTIGGVVLSSIYATASSVSAITAASLGLGNVTNLSMVTMFTNPDFTGTRVRIGTDTLATKAYARANGGGGGGGGSFATLTGSPSDNTNLQNALNLKLATNGSAASLTSFPTLNQNTTGSAATLTTPRSIYGNNFNGSAALTQVIASTYGGTGNQFTKFSGATITEKTYTLPNASAAILTDNAAVTVTQGGTGRATGTTAYGLIAAGTTATGAQQTLSNGISGQILRSAGAALPTWSTATYPSTSGTVRKVLMSDGTNFVSSIETYAAPSTSGNILQSDGTNWLSATPVELNTALIPDTVQHTSNYTIQASDWGKDQHCLKTTSIIITLPTNLTSWPVGGVMNFYGEGAGIMVFKGGVKISDKDSIATSRKGQVVSVKKIAASKYFLVGPLTD